MINFVFMLLLTSLTGSILFLVWYGIASMMEKSGYINIVFNILEGILLFWFLPISYWWLMINSHKRWGYVLFKKVIGIDVICKNAFVLWILCVSLLVCKLSAKFFAMRIQKKKCFPVDGDVFEQFCRICRELGIDYSKIDLLYDYKAVVPYISGYFKKYIVLPCREYTQEQLEIILFHELTHSKQRGMFLRYILEICVCIHFFNPMIWIYRNRLHFWEEYMCDYEVIKKINKPEYYFRVIEDISNHKFAENIFSLGLVAKDIRNRKAMMKRSYRMKRSRTILIVSIVFMLILSTSIVASATEMVGDGYYNAYIAAAEKNSSVEEEIEDIEYIAEGVEEGVIVHKDTAQIVNFYGSLINLEWHINGNQAQASANFYATSGQYIAVNAMTDPSSAVVRVGIQQPDGTIRYVLVNGTGGTYHRFAISQSGSYCVYIQNMSSNAIDVSVSYRVE